MKSFLLTLMCLAVPAMLSADWRSDADARIEKIRKGDFTLEVRDEKGAPIPGAKVAYELKHHEFLFGTAIAYAPYADPGDKGKNYRQFILDHFSGLVCENEMKWYSNEEQRGQIDYAKSDALLEFAEQNGLKMRGHCLFWEKQKYAQPWLAALKGDEFRAAIDNRLKTTVTRYAGRVVSWDVNNEMLDGSFYRDRIGLDGIANFFKDTAKLDPKVRLFVNEYGILGNAPKVERYLELIRELQKRGANVGGIGIQSHDSDRLMAEAITEREKDNRPEWMLKSALTPEAFLGSLDRLYSQTGLPIHLTEVSAKMPDPELRGQALEKLFRLGFSHPGVQAILVWGFEATTHWMGPQAALMEADGTLNAAGRRIDHLLREEWTTRGEQVSATDGRATVRGFFGTYHVRVTLPTGKTVERDVAFTGPHASAIVQIAP